MQASGGGMYVRFGAVVGDHAQSSVVPPLSKKIRRKYIIVNSADTSDFKIDFGKVVNVFGN